MELGALGGTREQYSDVKAREASEEEGASVALLLHLPNGSSHERLFKMGHTVAYVKLDVERAFGIRADRQQLTLAAAGGGGGRPMLDVLCLADYPQISAGAVNEVRVALAEEAG